MADLLNTNIGPERVQVFPIPTGTVQIPGSPTSVTAFLIAQTETLSPPSPVNVPTAVTDLTQFVNLFGGPDDILYDGYYAVEGFFNNAGTGNTAYIVNVGAGTPQSYTMTTVADVSGSLNSTYFKLYTPEHYEGSPSYYVWYNINSAGVDPAPAGFTRGIEVSAATNATAATIGTLTAAAISAAIPFNYSTTGSSGASVNLINLQGGTTTAPANGSANPGFTFTLVTAGADPTPADFIGNGALGTGLRSLDVIDDIDLVCVPGLPLSMAYLVDPAVIDYTAVIRCLWGETLSTTFSVLAVPKEVTTSTADVTVVSTTITSISSNVVGVAASPSALAAITPGMVVDALGIYTTTITAVNPTAQTITVESASALTVSEAILLAIPSAVTYVTNEVNTPSQSVAWYYNSLLVLDESSEATSGELVTVSPVGHVCGIMARIDANTSIGGVSHAPAGIQYAQISGINGLALSISERTDAAPLRLNFINRITSFTGLGTFVFGGYTAAGNSATPDQQLVQVIRAIMFIKSSLEAGLRSFLWENYSPITQNQVSTAVTAFLTSNIYLFPAGLPQAQQFQVVAVTPTQDELNQGLLVVTVLVRPNTAVRFIEINLEYPLPQATT
jgi:hypothetical protein